MGFGKRRYNAYRKRSYELSDKKRREYAKSMEDMYDWFSETDWSLSSMQDSAYKNFGKYEVRLSNHSADNQYHDLENGHLLVNIKKSKLEFQEYIEYSLPKTLQIVDNLDLEKYRFINIVGDRINCFYKNYKTKKDIFVI